MNIEMKKRSRSVYNIAKDHDRQDGYRCRTCNKRFDTFQALGGHQGTHKRVKLSDTSALNLDVVVHNSSALHQCKTCMKEFETGQALGGHMRRHRVEKDLILKEKERLWPQQVADKVESGLMVTESNLSLAESDMRFTEDDLRVAVKGGIDLMLVESDLKLVAKKVGSDLMLAESDLRLTTKKVGIDLMVESDLRLTVEKAESDLTLAESDLRLTAEKAESDLTLAGSDLRLAEKAGSELMSAAVEVQQHKAEEDKPEGDNGELVMAAKEWRLSV